MDQERKGLPSFRAKLGDSVERGRCPGRTTLNGFLAGSSTNACILWLMPIPVLPAMQAGFQPPLGVTETTHPFSSAAEKKGVIHGGGLVVVRGLLCCLAW